MSSFWQRALKGNITVALHTTISTKKTYEKSIDTEKRWKNMSVHIYISNMMFNRCRWVLDFELDHDSVQHQFIGFFFRWNFTRFRFWFIVNRPFWESSFECSIWFRGAADVQLELNFVLLIDGILQAILLYLECKSFSKMKNTLAQSRFFNFLCQSVSQFIFLFLSRYLWRVGFYSSFNVLSMLSDCFTILLFFSISIVSQSNRVNTRTYFFLVAKLFQRTFIELWCVSSFLRRCCRKSYLWQYKLRIEEKLHFEKCAQM